MKLNEFINNSGWRVVPSQIIYREGHVIDTSQDDWLFPISTQKCVAKFNRVNNSYLRYVIKMFVIHRTETTSSQAGRKAWDDFSAKIISKQVDFNLNDAVSNHDLEDSLINLLENLLANYRKEQKLYKLYDVIQWYIWSADNYPELGFCVEYALELDCIKIPGGPKGEAVRNGNASLHLSLELPLLIKALECDKSKKYSHLREKAAMALSIAFGRNASNLTFLMESDFENLAIGAANPCYIIKMPRIKKRLNSPRDDYKQEFLDERLALFISELIEANKKHYPQLYVETNEGRVKIERPIFINENSNEAAIKAKMYEFAYSNYSYQQTGYLKSFVKRHNIISPITKEPLEITTRRLRYTLATGLASEGISKAELARILDHTDTQHVHVYYDVRNAIVKHLTKAAAKGFSDHLNFFSGKVIDNKKEAINGSRDDKHMVFVNDNDPKDQPEIGVCGQDEICHLDPPFSCYLCPKFQAYRHADHDYVLECLLKSREERIKKYDSLRLGIQLDDVISAVAQVVNICEKRGLQ